MTYKTETLPELLSGNTYPGRGIFIGMTFDSRRIVICYFIMGRSENSRNRIFIEEGRDVKIKPFDPSKVEDPSLIIYYPIRTLENGIIVTNGDQTDTILEYINRGQSFEEALRTRCFEPDPPNWTPRISGMVTWEDPISYRLSILKAADADGSSCIREFFEYEASPGLGHFIHTYERDGDPLPTFSGEPVRVVIGEDMDYMARSIWKAMDKDNRISLCVRCIDPGSGETESILFNKHLQGEE